MLMPKGNYGRKKLAVRFSVQIRIPAALSSTPLLGRIALITDVDVPGTLI